MIKYQMWPLLLRLLGPIICESVNFQMELEVRFCGPSTFMKPWPCLEEFQEGALVIFDVSVIHSVHVKLSVFAYEYWEILKHIYI